METRDQNNVDGLKGQSKPTQPIFTWKNAYLAVGLMLLVTVLFSQVLNLLNADYTRLEARINRVASSAAQAITTVSDWAEMGLTSLQESLKSVFTPDEVKAETNIESEEEPTWKVLVDSASSTAYEWELPQYTLEVMADPSLHVPALEEISRFTEEGTTYPDYVQKEFETLDTWVLNSQEVRDTLWLDMLNSSHTDHIDGQPVMVEFYEWRVGVWGSPYYFEIHDSETPGYALVTWIDENGLNHVEMLPQGAFIKVAHGKGDIYFYLEPNGLPSFTYPYNGYPLFQIEFVMMEETFETVIVDSEQPVPYGLMEDMEDSFNFMLHRKWTQNIECPLFLDESTVCNSLNR